MKAWNVRLVLTVFSSWLYLSDTLALQHWQERHPPVPSGSHPSPLSRREAMTRTVGLGTSGLLAGLTGNLLGTPANSVARAADQIEIDRKNKQLNLSSEQLARIVIGDVTERQFMVTGDFTRSIYDEAATFTDEIDTYEMDPWINGVKRLFIPKGSHIELLADTLTVSDSVVELKFAEDLQFNLILLQPTLSLTGRLVLNRDPTSGLITSYREFWDQDISSVLKTARF
jgi:hypothetical protein